MIDNFNELITEAGSICIAGHIRPDGDCAGSTLAVYNYIVNKYPDKEVHIILQTIPSIFKFLKNSDKIESEETYDITTVFDLFICLDCGDGNRLGRSFELFKNAAKTICIDHHASNESFADYNYIIPDESSTCELVYNQLGDENIDEAIAECLYTGIIHDTGIFQYDCCTSDTLRVAANLKDKGIDTTKICRESYCEKTLKQNRILGEVLLNAKMYLDNKVIASVFTKEDLERHNANSKDLEGCVQQLNLTKGTEAAVFLYEIESGDFKGSTRSSGIVDLVKVCKEFGGGGHVKAAGFNVYTNEPWKEIDNIVSLIGKQLGY